MGHEERDPTTMERARARMARERLALVAHREKLGGAAFPAVEPRESSFVHGFLLPFSLVAATMRHPVLGPRLLAIVVARATVLVAVASLVLAKAHAPELEGDDTWWLALEHRWARVVWYVTVLSLTEAVVAHLSRRYDEHLAWHVAAIARIWPESAVPPTPEISVGLGELYVKARRFVHGYLILGTALPVLVVAACVPLLGAVLSPVIIFTWTAYWFAVFGAGKTRHAYVDEASAPPPRIFRELLAATTGARWLSPFHRLLRLQARIVRSANAPAMVFERTPSAYLGFALARVVLSLPGLYGPSRSAITVAAARLCAESDPLARFRVDPPSVPGR